MKIGKAWVLILLSTLAACATGPKMSDEVQAAKLAADAAKDEAVEVKASRAAEAEFNSAQNFYDEAEKAFKAGSEADAIASYGDAASEFLIAAGIAKEARAGAEEAIAGADREIAKTEQIVEDIIKSVTEGR